MKYPHRKGYNKSQTVSIQYNTQSIHPPTDLKLLTLKYILLFKDSFVHKDLTFPIFKFSRILPLKNKESCATKAILFLKLLIEISCIFSPSMDIVPLLPLHYIPCFFRQVPLPFSPNICYLRYIETITP